MFKLKKIIGAKNSIPEITTFYNDASNTEVTAGCIYMLDNSTLACELLEDNTKEVKFLSLITVRGVEEYHLVPGILITRDMVFEADCDDSLSHVTVGDKVNLAYGYEGDIAKVTASDDATDAIVVDISNFNKKKIDIMFL